MKYQFLLVETLKFVSSGGWEIRAIVRRHRTDRLLVLAVRSTQMVQVRILVANS